MTFSVVPMAAARAVAFSVVMATTDMAFPMVTAHGVRIVGQGARQEGFHLGIGISSSSGEQADPRLSQSIPSTASDVAADQGLHALLL